MPAKDVKAYVKCNKNDVADAEAICEAVRRPTMRFVLVKSAEQQGQLMQHRTRDLLMRQRTAPSCESEGVRLPEHSAHRCWEPHGRPGRWTISGRVAYFGGGAHV